MAVFIDGVLQPDPNVKVISETVKINGEIVKPTPVVKVVKRKSFWKRLFTRK